MKFSIKKLDQYSNLELIALILLLVFSIRFICCILRGFWTCFLANLLGFGVKWCPGKDVWAVITGATSGIGLEYARQLASIGYSLVIISRNKDKLTSTAKMLMEENFNCKQVKTIAVDFSQTDIYDEIENELKKLHSIDVLVNNVGTINNFAKYFAKIPPKYNRIVFNVNMLSYTRMLELILPKMIQNRRGIIINISSFASQLPSPLMSMYSSSNHILSNK